MVLRVEQEAKLCKFVAVSCGFPSGLPHTVLQVSRGLRLGTCIVEACSPDPCIYIPGFTRVIRAPSERVEVEKRNSLVVVRLARNRESEVFVYPLKVWNAVEELIVEPVTKSLKLRQQGAVFVGPPGTGKSSLARVLQAMLSIPVIDVTPTRVLSKYLGESERLLEALLSDAEASEPCVVFADEGEWLVAHRFMGAELEVTRAYVNMASIFLSRLQKWHSAGRYILVLITTNVDVSYIDQAYLRAGRLGDPIMFPLPDRETIVTYIEEVLRDTPVGREEVEEVASKALSLGLSMADIASSLESFRRKLERGERVALVEEVSFRKPRESAYYKRGYADAKSRYGKALLRKLRERYKYMASCDRLYLHITLPEPVALAVATAFAIHVLGSQPVIAVDPRYIDTAVLTAETHGAVLIAPTQSIPRELLANLHLKAKRVVYAGLHKPFDWILTLSVGGEPGDLLGIAELVLSFYNVKYTPQDIDTLAKVSNLRDKLQYIASAPSIEVLAEVKTA